MPLFDLAYAGPPNPTVNQISMRRDCTGAAMEMTGAARLTNGNAPILYDQGFTVEMAIKPTTIGVRAVGGGTSRIVPGVQSHANANDQSVFQLGFDNWASGGGVLVPTFTILSDNNTYQSLLDHAVILGEARGRESMVLGHIYHLLGTLDANGLCQLYVNGVLKATASPNINMVDFISAANANLDLGNASRTLRDVFDIGTRFLDGAYRTEPDTGEARIDNVRFYPQHFNATQAEAAAAEIRFTDTAAEDAPAYGLTQDEISAGDPGGAGTPRMDMFWKPDGTRVFTCEQDEEIAQNDVSPAWGIQIGDWTNLVLTAQFNQLRSIWWSADGNFLSRCLRVPSFNMNVTVYDQSATPFDLTVLGSSTSKTFPVTPALAGGPADHVWSADGLTLWVHYPANAARSIYEWSVTVPFDPSTLIQPQNKSFDVEPDTGNDLHTWAFSADGTMLYGMDGQFLVSWDLPTPYDVSTATNFQTGPEVPAVNVSITRGLALRSDNTDISIQGDQNQRRVAWFRIATVAKDASEYCLKSDDPNPTGIGQRFRYDTFWQPDGLRVWVRQPVGESHPAIDNLFQFDVSPAWATTGWVQTASQQIAGDNEARSIEWTNNGNTLSFLSVWFSSFRRMDSFDQSATPYDITALGAGSGFTALVGLGQFQHHWNLDSQGSAAGSFCMVGASGGEYQRYPASTPGDITTFGAPDQLWDSRIDAGSRSESDIAVSTDGLKVYSVTSGGLLCSWDLTAQFDFSAPFNFTTGPDTDVPVAMGIARGMNYRRDNGDIILLADQNTFAIRCWGT